jgi:hypothetical protein
MAKIKTRKGQITTLSKAIQLNTGGARKCRRRVSRSYSRDRGIRRVTLVTNQELSGKKKQRLLSIRFVIHHK